MSQLDMNQLLTRLLDKVADLAAPGVDPLLGPLARQHTLKAAKQAGEAVGAIDDAVATAWYRLAR